MAVKQNTRMKSTAEVSHSEAQPPPSVGQTTLPDFCNPELDAEPEGEQEQEKEQEPESVSESPQTSEKASGRGPRTPLTFTSHKGTVDREVAQNGHSEDEVNVDADAKASTESEACPECGGHVVTEGHESVCEGCGLVVDEYTIDHGPEWRMYSDSTTNPSRVSPIKRTHHDNGMGTTGFRAGLGASMQERRMQTIQNRGSDTREKNLRKSLGDLKLAVSTLEASDAVEQIGANLFKKFYNGDKHNGHSLDHMIAATVYSACRVCDAGFTADDVAEKLDVDRRSLYSELKRLKEAVDMPIPIEEPVDYIPRFVNELDGTPQIQTVAQNVAAEIHDRSLLVGCKPSGIAAAVVYLTFRKAQGIETRTQTEVGTVADVSEKTIRSNYRKIESSDVDIPVVEGSEVEAKPQTTPDSDGETGTKATA